MCDMNVVVKPTVAGCKVSNCATTLHGFNLHKKKQSDKWKRIFLIRERTEDGGIGVHKQDGGNAEISPLFIEDCLKSWTQLWFHKDANGARRYMTTGLMLPKKYVGQAARACSSTGDW